MSQPRTSFVNQLLGQIMKDQINDLSAQLAYYFLLSLFPLLIFMLTLLPFLQIDPDPVIQWLVSHAPGGASNLIESNVRPLLTNTSGGLLSFGVLATLWSASNATSAIFRALNKAYNVEETRPFWRVKLYAILLTIALIFVIAITLLLPVFGKLILGEVTRVVQIPSFITTLINAFRWVVGSVIMVVVLMGLYYLAPDVALKFRYVLPGALVATVSWQIISFGFSFYVSQFAHFTSTYGSLGGVIILMLWFFLTGMILMVGGEVNAVFFNRHKIR